MNNQPKLYQENTLTGEVIWVGKSGLVSMNEHPIAPSLNEEKHAYVIMKVRIDD